MAGRRIGAFWKPKEGSKAMLNGSIELLGVTIRVSMFKNTDEGKKEGHPDYHIVSYGIEVPKQADAAPAPAADMPDSMPF